MATGDQSDFLRRLKATLPGRWFPDVSPILDGILSGPAWAWSWLYALLGYVKNQRRIATATGVNLDLIANDFLGAALPRNKGEPDSSYRPRVQAQILQPKATREAVARTLKLLTGHDPVIFEPMRPADTGAYAAALPVPGISYASFTPGRIGQGGMLPPGWLFAGGGVQGIVVGGGVLNSQSYIDIRFAGTMLYPYVVLMLGAAQPTAPGQKWTESLSAQVLSGSLPTGGLSFNVRFSAREQDFALPVTGDLAAFYANATSDAASTSVRPAIITYDTPGTYLDFTLRIRGATFETEGAQTSLPAPFALAYNQAGGYGNLGLPFQCFITAQRPTTGGIVGVNGYNGFIGAYGGSGGRGAGASEYGSLSQLVNVVTDGMIYDAVAQVMPVASIAWTRIGAANMLPPPYTPPPVTYPAETILDDDDAPILDDLDNPIIESEGVPAAALADASGAALTDTAGVDLTEAGAVADTTLRDTSGKPLLDTRNADLIASDGVASSALTDATGAPLNDTTGATISESDGSGVVSPLPPNKLGQFILGQSRLT